MNYRIPENMGYTPYQIEGAEWKKQEDTERGSLVIFVLCWNFILLSLFRHGEIFVLRQLKVVLSRNWFALVYNLRMNLIHLFPDETSVVVALTKKLLWFRGLLNIPLYYEALSCQEKMA